MGDARPEERSAIGPCRRFGGRAYGVLSDASFATKLAARRGRANVRKVFLSEKRVYRT